MAADDGSWVPPPLPPGTGPGPELLPPEPEPASPVSPLTWGGVGALLLTGVAATFFGFVAAPVILGAGIVALIATVAISLWREVADLAPVRGVSRAGAAVGKAIAAAVKGDFAGAYRHLAQVPFFDWLWFFLAIAAMVWYLRRKKRARA